ncbi:MAG: MAPEG family protein [Venatoribacter sp.]
MTLAYWCVFVAAVMPYIFTLVAKSGGRYNNHAPRDFLEKQEGIQRRANWTQLNSFEAFPAFAAAVIIAHLQEVSQGTINFFAVSFIIFRIAYAYAYLTDKAQLRSIVWGLGFICVISLFISAA